MYGGVPPLTFAENATICRAMNTNPNASVIPSNLTNGLVLPARMARRPSCSITLLTTMASAITVGSPIEGFWMSFGGHTGCDE